MFYGTAIFLSVLMVLLGFIFTGCERTATGGGHDFPEPPREVLEAFDPELAGSANELGVNLMAQLLVEDENIFISPTSIAAALSMTYNGARRETREAMAQVLGVQGVDLKRLNENNQALLYLLQEADPSVKMHIANSLWMREGMEFDADFVQQNEKYYNAAVKELDFDAPEAADAINSWVKDRTGGHIEDIIEPPIDPFTILFLINAIYFQGDWSEPFPEDKTEEDTFNLPGGESKTVPFMHRSGELSYYEEEDFQAVRLPYGEKEQMAMYVFLPAEDLALQEFVQKFSTAWWEEKLQQFYKAEGDLYLPRFSMEYEKSLNDILKTLGMEIAFDENRADLFDMVPWEGSPRLYISEVKHMSFIEVNEKGTEAAAATSVEIRVESAPPFTFHMKVDRPFFFLIQDEKTGTLIFMGTVTDPSR